MRKRRISLLKREPCTKPWTQMRIHLVTRWRTVENQHAFSEI